MSRLARVLTALDRAPPPVKLVPPTLDFLLGMGAVSSNPLHRWLLRRCGQWCAPWSLLAAPVLNTTGTSTRLNKHRCLHHCL